MDGAAYKARIITRPDQTGQIEYTGDDIPLWRVTWMVEGYITSGFYYVWSSGIPVESGSWLYSE